MRTTSKPRTLSAGGLLAAVAGLLLVLAPLADAEARGGRSSPGRGIGGLGEQPKVPH